jgi:hypothetical protein
VIIVNQKQLVLVVKAVVVRVVAVKVAHVVVKAVVVKVEVKVVVVAIVNTQIILTATVVVNKMEDHGAQVQGADHGINMVAVGITGEGMEEVIPRGVVVAGHGNSGWPTNSPFISLFCSLRSSSQLHDTAPDKMILSGPTGEESFAKAVSRGL